jgi:hypothetical protein
MFSLIDGIYLEDSGKLLRWGCSRKEALSIGHPIDIDNPRVKWREKILDGQSCDLVVDLADDGVFDEARALLHGTMPYPDGFLLYRTLSDQFTKKIGRQPSTEPAGKYDEAPILIWQHDGCILKLTVWDAGQQGGPATDLLISKKK